jgi:hypothetical protein
LTNGAPISAFKTPIDTGYYIEASSKISRILQDGRNNRDRWSESDNAFNVIRPILSIIGFYKSDLYGKKSKRSQETKSPHRPDLELRFIGEATVAVIEEKPFNTAFVRKSSSGYSTPLDQILTYLEHFPNVYGILSNGRHWLLLRARSDIREDFPMNCHYVGAAFNLESAFRDGVDGDNLRAFIGMCMPRRLFAYDWPDDEHEEYHLREIPRDGYSTAILLRDFSGGTVLKV